MYIRKSIVYLFFLVTLFFTNACKEQTRALQSESNNIPILVKDTVVRLATKSKPVTIEDSIRQHFGIEDSIKVIQSRYYSSDAPEHFTTVNTIINCLIFTTA